MMVLSDAKQSSQNTEDVKSKGEINEQETALNNNPEELSDKVVSENITAGEKIPILYKRQNGSFEKETESYEIIRNICQSFNAFQNTITEPDQTVFLNDAFNEGASVIERSPTSYASDNLLPNASEPRIRAITEANEKDGDIKQNFKFLHDALNDYVSVKGSSEISCATGDFLPNISERGILAVTDTNVQDTKTSNTRTSSTVECSTSRSTIIPKSENLSPISNGISFKFEMYCDIFKEDDDWDIYQPGLEMTKTKSLRESEPSFETQKNKIAQYWPNNEAKRCLVFSSCQKESPSTERGIRYSRTDNFVNNGGTLLEWKIKEMLRTVEKFFLENPVQVTDNLDYLERDMCITTTPYFSKDFALRHGLTPFTVSYTLQINLPKDPSKVSKLFTAYELISSLGISEKDFFHYISIDEKRRACEWNGNSELDRSIITELDLIQEHVGTDIFYMVYESLKTDDYSRALLRNPELLKYAILYWNGCEKNIYPLEEKLANVEYNEADSTSDVVTEDIHFSEMNADFPSTSSGSRVIKTPHLDNIDSNSFSNDRTSEDIVVAGTNVDYPSTSSGSHVIKTPHLHDVASNSFANDGTSEDIVVSRINVDFHRTTSGCIVIKTPHLDHVASNSFADDGTSEDIVVSGINVDFHRTTSGSCAIKTPDLNLNSYADDRKKEYVKDRQYSKDLPKVQSVEPTDILETELKCSPMTQSTNEENKENLNSFDLLQGSSEKSPGLSSLMLQRTENSSHQYDEETQKKVHLVTSRTSQNNATHSSCQAFKGKSKDDQSEKSFEAFKNVSKMQPRVRKYSSQDDDTKSIKKIRLQENPNIGQLKPNKEKTPRKDKSISPCQNSWPKPRNKSCIIM